MKLGQQIVASVRSTIRLTHPVPRLGSCTARANNTVSTTVASWPNSIQANRFFSTSTPSVGKSNGTPKARLALQTAICTIFFVGLTEYLLVCHNLDMSL